MNCLVMDAIAKTELFCIGTESSRFAMPNARSYVTRPFLATSTTPPGSSALYAESISASNCAANSEGACGDALEGGEEHCHKDAEETAYELCRRRVGCEDYLDSDPNQNGSVAVGTDIIQRRPDETVKRSVR